MKGRPAALPARQCFEAASRLIAGEDMEALAREYSVSTCELSQCRERLEALLEKEAKNEARKAALQATRETWVEDQVRRHLSVLGYSVETRQKLTGPDILAAKDGKTLLVEVKGDRPGHVSSSGTIKGDVLTLLGQIVMAKSERAADDYAIAVRPVHMRLLQKAVPILNELAVGIIVVEDDGIRVIDAG